MSILTTAWQAAPETESCPVALTLSARWSAWVRHPRRELPLALAVLAVWCGSLFFYGLRSGELYRTEGLRAIIAAEFLRSGNWLVPYLYQTPLLTKPPGMYAAIAALSWPQGYVDEYTARLPSALGATAFLFLLFSYVRRQAGTLTSLVVALITPTGFLWLDKASSAEIDMLQTAWVGISVLFFLRAVESEEEGQPALRWWFLALGCVAGGVLTKWTGALFFYGMAVPYLLWRKQFRLLFTWRHLLPAFLFGGLCLAWLTAAFLQIGWDLAWFQLSVEAGPRLLHDSTHSRQATPTLIQDTLLHPFKIWGINLPFAFFALLTLRPTFLHLWDEKGQRLLQGLHCWAWPNLLLMTILPDHATRHSFPLCPAITALAGLAVAAWITGRLAWLPRWQPAAPRLLFLLLLGWFIGKMVFVELFVPHRQDRRGTKQTGALMASKVPPGQTLYLCTVKDECIMFYYGRPVKRLESWDDLPCSGPAYCILEDAPRKPEWREFQARGKWKTHWEVALKDGQGDGLRLVAVERR